MIFPLKNFKPENVIQIQDSTVHAFFRFKGYLLAFKEGWSLKSILSACDPLLEYSKRYLVKNGSWHDDLYIIVLFAKKTA